MSAIKVESPDELLEPFLLSETSGAANFAHSTSTFHQGHRPRRSRPRFHFSSPLCLVNLNLLSEALWCNSCDVPLSLRACLEERTYGDTLLLSISCIQCRRVRQTKLCNDDPDDDTYRDPGDVSCKPALAHNNSNVPRIKSTLTADGIYVLEESVRQRRAKASVAVTRGRRGRPRGSKTRNFENSRKRNKKLLDENDSEDEEPLVKRIKITIKPPPSPPENSTPPIPEATYSDDSDIDDQIDFETPTLDTQKEDGAKSDDDNNESEIQDKKPMQCQYCARAFENKTRHARHMKTDHPEVRSFFCEICAEEFTTIYFLRKHKMAYHLPKDSPKCDACGQAFLTQELLNAHKLKHLPKNARHFKCGQCSKKFFEEKRLKVHIKRFHEKKEGSFKCDYCPRSYETKRKLMRHIIEHIQDDIFAMKHGNEYARWKCEYCDKIFKNMGRQLVHMRECHPEFKALICGWCREQCTTVKSFQKHRRMNHRTDSLCVCDECGKATLNPKKLALHKLSHRTDNEGKEFLCSYCPRAFAENSSLVDHIKRFHIITTYYCEHCPKTFKMKFNIRRHMQLHTGVFRHSCPHCGANFVAADGRDHHIRNCHRFMCVICSSIFPTKDEVVVHRANDHPSASRGKDGDPIFEKITDFNCEVCFRYLSSKQALNTHLRTHMKKKSKEGDFSIAD